MISIDDLVAAYTNEKATRRLLKYECVVDKFSRAVADACSSQTGRDHSQSTQVVQEIEAGRIRYFVKEYILCRFDKIRRSFFLDPGLMSPRERAFYARHLEIMKQNGVYTDSPSRDTEFVGFISHRNLESVRIDNEVVEIFKGDFFVANFDDVAEYLREGAIGLV